MSSCSEPAEIELNEDLIFRRSFPIDISSYHYQAEDGTIYEIKDDNDNTGIPDTLDGRPVISWESIASSLVSAGIFRNPIVVEQGEIINLEDLIWQWHSGMNIDSAGYVQFSEGKNVINGVIDYNNPPETLEDGQYYWAVWAWQSSGVKILFSSRPRQFYVVN